MVQGYCLSIHNDSKLQKCIIKFAALISLKPGGLPLWQYFFYIRTGFGWVFGTAGLTGVLLTIIFVIMALFALSCVRRKGFFEVKLILKLL